MSINPSSDARIWRLRAESLEAENETLRAKISDLEFKLEAFTQHADIPLPLLDGPFRLTPRQLQLFKLLWRHKPRVVQRAVLWNEILGTSEPEGPDKLLDVFISHIRKKLREAGLPLEVKTQWGYGYGLVEGTNASGLDERLNDLIEAEVNSHPKLNNRQIAAYRRSLRIWLPRLLARDRWHEYELITLLKSAAAPGYLRGVKKLLRELGFVLTSDEQRRIIRVEKTS